MYQDKYFNRVMGELEAFIGEDSKDWDSRMLQKALSLLTDVQFELQDIDFRIKLNEDEVKTEDTRKHCVICGKLTSGSVGKAGIKWKIICQDCKDNKDDELDIMLKGTKSFLDAVEKIIER